MFECQSWISNLEHTLILIKYLNGNKAIISRNLNFLTTVLSQDFWIWTKKTPYEILEVSVNGTSKMTESNVGFQSNLQSNFQLSFKRHLQNSSQKTSIWCSPFVIGILRNELSVFQYTHYTLFLQKSNAVHQAFCNNQFTVQLKNVLFSN